MCASPGYATLLARGRRFFYGWGRTGCTASRDRQYKTQSKSREYLRQHARDRSIGEPPTTCVEFCTERDTFRISEEEDQVIKIPNDILRCRPLHGSASPGITGTGINGTRIIGPTASHGTIGVAVDHRHLGPPDHQVSQGSTDRQCPLHPGSHQLRLSQALEPTSTTRPTVRRGFTRSRQQKDSRGKTPRQDPRNQHRTVKSLWRHLRSSCTPASQPHAFSLS